MKDIRRYFLLWLFRFLVEFEALLLFLFLVILEHQPIDLFFFVVTFIFANANWFFIHNFKVISIFYCTIIIWPNFSFQ